MTLAFLSLASVAFTQDDVFSNKTNLALEKVVKDFPNRFHNIKGDLIVQHAQSAEYKSTIQVPGATACIIKHSAVNADAYSWSCTAMNSHDFVIAKNKFKEIYDQIENTIIKVDGQKPFIITGQYRTPYEEKKLTTVVFELLPAVGEMKKLKIELTLQSISSEWKVSLTVYDSDHKDDEATAASN
ncbi:MAG: hypothetical protein C5B59_15300 [Bacteroidetes bacterium]|nr:MAG: hypothetical protein C5B59_15300 [Bacteroidota bacterium]